MFGLSEKSIVNTSSYFLVGLCCLLARPVWADEGMWTPDNLPVKILQEKHGFEPDADWLEHVRLSAVRIGRSGSGAFVSAYGLVATNNHVAVDQLQKMSSAERDYLSDGFYAQTPAEEIRCMGLELNVLVSMQNVTAKVMAAVKPGMAKEVALQARRAVCARIEKEAMDQSGLRADVISLYQGSEYWLHGYRSYTDVRLVWSPGQQVAFFGGQTDNFSYPRYDLDVAFFRVYQDGKPLRPEHYLRWNSAGPSEGELVFVPGHPGSTSRLHSVAQVRYHREVVLPAMEETTERVLAGLNAYAARGPEQQRRAQAYLFMVANQLKAVSGMRRTLADRKWMKRRQQQELAFRARVASRPEWQKNYAGAWAKIEASLAKGQQEFARQTYRKLHRFGLPGIAMAMVLLGEEIQKPDAKRMAGFHESELSRVKFYLLSPQPLHRDLEAVMLELGFRGSLDKLPGDDPFVQMLRGLGEPKQAAESIIGKTRLLDVAFRKELIEGGSRAIAQSDDPLLSLARKTLPALRANLQWRKKHMDSVLVPALAQIAEAHFAVYGKDTYPDANFTFRLSFGTVRGYPMNGTRAPYQTTLYGLFDRALGFDRKGDWQLPDWFWQRKDRLDLATPVNFVSDCDITGGSSGSPVINRKSELVGIVFDGNMESLAGRYFFDAVSNRAVSVHAAYVIEALRKLYDAADLADEIEAP